MSEEQGKQKLKWYKNWWNYLFLLIFVLLITLLCVRPMGHIENGPGPGGQYHTISDELKNAVAQYATDHDGALPILNGTYTNDDCSNCSVINISALLIANGGLLREVPHNCNLSASGNDNCGGDASLGCRNESSYFWLVDTNGSVFSYCAGAGCTTNNSGYQDVWP